MKNCPTPKPHKYKPLMEEAQLFHNRYHLVRLLGRGNFSEVWLAEDTKTATEVALKIYAPSTGLDNDGLSLFAREFAIVLNANHNNLLKPMHFDTCDRKPYLVLPYCHEGSTQRRIGIFKEKEIWHMLHDVASGLAFLHDMKPPVIHQDIKPDNIMLGDNDNYMLSDFGVSSHCKSALRRSMSDSFASAGTTAYMAPERFGKNSATPIMASDIYSLGATAFELLMGTPPFGNDGGLIQMKGAEIPELKSTYSTDLRKVIRLCLNNEPWKRPTAAQLAAYAEKGMKGERIAFNGKKSPKRLTLIAATGITIFAIAIWAYSSHNQQMSDANTTEKIQISTDSIMRIANIHLANGDRLLKKARLKEENYDNTYLQARKEYCDAITQIKSIGGSNEKIASANKCITEIDTTLQTAYKTLMQKAEIFKDEPQVKAEFENRANRIKQIVNK